MNSSPYLYIPAEEKADVSLDEEQRIKRIALPGHKISISIFALLFVGLLVLLGIIKLNIPLSNAVSIKHVDEKTYYTPREATPGDLYLLGVGKADITGFVHQYLLFQYLC
jgi:hypothetical protein